MGHGVTLPFQPWLWSVPMKILPLALALCCLLPAGRAQARDHDLDLCGMHASCCSPPVHWRARHDVSAARFAIVTRDGDATLLLTDRAVAVQLSDRAMHRVIRELRDEQEEYEDNVLARSIKSVVLSGVRALLDHSAECRLRDIDDVACKDGRLIITTIGGDGIFENLDVHDSDVMSAFSAEDARAFVREFQRLRARGI